jgi:hypothetical protein
MKTTLTEIAGIAIILLFFIPGLILGAVGTILERMRR